MAVGAQEMIKVEKIQQGEVLRLNIGTAVTLGPVGLINGNIITVNLKRPICAASGSRVAVTRRIADRWRLIGSGIII